MNLPLPASSFGAEGAIRERLNQIEARLLATILIALSIYLFGIRTAEHLRDLSPVSLTKGTDC